MPFPVPVSCPFLSRSVFCVFIFFGFCVLCVWFCVFVFCVFICVCFSLQVAFFFGVLCVLSHFFLSLLGSGFWVLGSGFWCARFPSFHRLVVRAATSQAVDPNSILGERRKLLLLLNSLLITFLSLWCVVTLLLFFRHGSCSLLFRDLPLYSLLLLLLLLLFVVAFFFTYWCQPCRVQFSVRGIWLLCVFYFQFSLPPLCAVLLRVALPIGAGPVEPNSR